MTSHERSRAVRLGRATARALAAVLGVAVGCSSGSSSSGGTTTDDGVTVTVDPQSGLVDLFSSTDEARLYQLTGEGGDLITVFGEKDADGAPTAATALFAQQPAQIGTNAGTWLYFDPEGRVSKIVAADGSVIELSWQSASAVVVSGLTADGAAQLNTSIDLAQTATAASAAPLGPFAMRAGTPPPATCDETAPAALAGAELNERNALFTPASPRALAAASSLLVRARVQRCGETVAEGEVQEVHMTAVHKKGASTYPAQRQDSGTYVATIPVGALTPPNNNQLANICLKLGKVVVKSCEDGKYAEKMKNTLCVKIAGALDKAGLAGKGASISKGCLDAYSELMKNCDKLNIGDLFATVITGDPDKVAKGIGAEICKKIKNAVATKFDLELDLTGSVMVAATATVKGAGAKSSGAIDATAAAAIGGTPPAVTIDFGTDTKVGALTLSPASPPAGTSYTISVTVACGAGKKFTTKVVGTDGYTKTSDFNPTGATATLSTTVPGAAKGVSDKVTVYDATGTVVREAGLTFQ